MSMSKKNYIAIADVFARGYAIATEIGDPNGRLALNFVRRELTTYMKNDNPRFDADIFTNSCLVPRESLEADKLYMACLNLTKETDNGNG